ncbi:ATP-binding protein [Streptomyces sp. NPDC005574]|uniref:ATP-binding protein n=1 Tax=Streptomyces sp. NPDC005574 TaxID=3156891 RepID=UPI0033AA24E5
MKGPDHVPDRAATAARVTTSATARARARTLVREQWESSSRTAREEDAIDLLLVVSELVANAIRHGNGPAGFDISLTPEGVRPAVGDNSAVVPPEAHGCGVLPSGHHGSGYGRSLIIRLAREITIGTHAGTGRTIRVTVPLREVPERPEDTGRRT